MHVTFTTSYAYEKRYLDELLGVINPYSKRILKKWNLFYVPYFHVPLTM